MTDPISDHDLDAWAKSARQRGYEDGFKGRPQQNRLTTDAPPRVRDAYIAGYTQGSGTRARVAAFKARRGTRPRI